MIRVLVFLLLCSSFADTLGLWLYMPLSGCGWAPCRAPPQCIGKQIERDDWSSDRWRDDPQRGSLRRGARGRCFDRARRASNSSSYLLLRLSVWSAAKLLSLDEGTLIQGSLSVTAKPPVLIHEPTALPFPHTM